ncbi:MAG: hypothetical protein KDB07_12755, partial [Planctomycetes bacterium]|nr:hypothetical protein [Planctomycetota bacterium]
MADLREPKFARWDDAAKNFTSVTIGDVPLDMVEPWTWPLYRGAKARPVMLIQGSQKRGRFDFLGYGPHTMDITAPTRGDSVEHYQIDGVYIESIDPISDERIRLKLYDARVVLRETVWPIDINVKMPDGTYKVNTSKADKEPWTYRDVLTELDRQTGIELNIDV